MISTKKLIFFLFIFCWTPLAFHVQVGTTNSDFTSLEDKLEGLRETYNIPTIHVALTRNKKLIWCKGFGNETTPNTVFLIGSNQKPVIATTILQLYEQGLIDLDADISTYLPFEVKHPDFPNDIVTIRMLLTHTSGLTSELFYEFYWDTEGKFSSYNGVSNPSILNLDLGQFLNESFTPGGENYYTNMWKYKPGEKYSYSNTGFKLLHYLVECISNQSFEEYLQTNVFTPLNMTNSGINASQFSTNHATPYTRRYGTDEILEVYSSWQIRSSVSDMARFLIAHLNNGVYEGNQILKSSTVEMMHEQKVQYSTHRNSLIQDVKNYKFYQYAYGLGWSRFHDGFGGHGGSTPGFISVMAGRKNSDGSSTGIVLFMNINALFGSSQDREEVQIAYNKLINTVLFNLNLIPPINQDIVDLYVFFATIWLSFCLTIYSTVQILNKEKITIRYYSLGGNNNFQVLPLAFGVAMLIMIFNYFNLRDWMRVLFIFPVVSYLVVLLLYNIFYKKNVEDRFSPLFRNASNFGSIFISQIWLIIGFIGLFIYNDMYSTLPSLISSILCCVAISLVLIHLIQLLKNR